ncbi:Phosphatidylinositol-4-phosphate 5-kinase [Linnemannia exigua]|uniref:1-phosphatidylinositol-4-phosphate 5-kinase n=1 Tax=Linnemannia exigua TaxID=604196 RepID=A0AAD4D4G2_9FUNG|nr:Phosphatidylinositol-4-phosphate 5-kinase [Linnemannia exigua]
MTPQEDSSANGLPDLVPQGNGVYALPAAYPHTVNTAIQKVSEGTQTTPKISPLPTSPKAHSLPSHPHSRQHPSSPPPSPPQPPALALGSINTQDNNNNNNNNNKNKDDSEPAPLSPLPQVQPNGTNGIYSDPGPFQLDSSLSQLQPQQQQQQQQKQQRQSSLSSTERAFTQNASETQPMTIPATSLSQSSSSKEERGVPAPAVTGPGAHSHSLGSLPAPDQHKLQQWEQGAALFTSTKDTDNTLETPSQTTGVPPADSLAEHHPVTYTPTAPSLPVSVTIPLTVDVNVNVNIIKNSENGTTVASPPHPAPGIGSPTVVSHTYTYTYATSGVESTPFPHQFPVILSSEHTVPSLPTSPSTPIGSLTTKPLSLASIEQEQLFLSQQQQLHQLQQEPQEFSYEHHEQQQPMEYQQQVRQQPPVVDMVHNDLKMQQQPQTQLQVQSQHQGHFHMQEGQPQQRQQQQQQQSIPMTPQNARDGDIGPMVPPKSPGGPFDPPARASTMEIRRIRPGSPDSPQGESSSRARHRQIYRRNTYSADLGSASFRRSDDEMEMDELEEARRRMEALKKSSSRRMSKRKKDEDNDRVMIGTRIGEDHVNYVLMYNMLTGIRVSVSRCNAKPQRMLVDEDFTAAHKLAFDITGNELTPSSKYDFKFKDYAPWVFRHLREDFHIDASDYLVSLTSKYILSELGSPGKSGSFFYFSQDYRFIIKTIHHAEHKFMRKILKDYFNHVKRNPHTLLCRFFGLHRVKLPHGRKIHFVVMGNVFPPNRDIHETYDLKGSTLGRAISDEELASNPRATQKDLNWVNRNRKLELGPEKRHLFVEQIKRDVELLSRLNIMDYSLLIGIHDIERGNKDNIRDNTLKVFHPDTSKPLKRETTRKDKRESKLNALRMAVKVSDPQALGPSTLPSDSFSERRHFIFYADDGGLLSTNEQNEQGEDLYYLGIIDILTPYNYVKKIEHAWKSLSQDKHAISAVNPREYASRFLSFMIHAIKVNHDVMAALLQSSQHNSHPHSE